MCDTKCVGHWNLVSEVGLPEPDREVVFTYTNGVNDYRMVDVGAYFTQDLLTESFEKNKEGFFKGQMNKDAQSIIIIILGLCMYTHLKMLQLGIILNHTKRNNSYVSIK